MSTDGLDPAGLLRQGVASDMVDGCYKRAFELPSLEQEWREKGKQEQFRLLKPILTEDREVVDYGNLSRNMDMSDVNTRVSAHRIRKRYRELLKEEIHQTLGPEIAVEDELKSLLGSEYEKSCLSWERQL